MARPNRWLRALALRLAARAFNFAGYSPSAQVQAALNQLFAQNIGDRHPVRLQDLQNNQSWLYAANRQIAGRATRVEPTLELVTRVQGKSHKRTPVHDHPFLDLLAQPNLDQTGKVFHWQSILMLNTAGRAYIRVEPEILDVSQHPILSAVFGNTPRVVTRIARMTLLEPDRVRVLAAPGRWAAAYEYFPIYGGKEAYYAAPATWAEREAWKREPTPFVIRVLMPAPDSWNAQGVNEAAQWAIGTTFGLTQMWQNQLKNGVHAGLIFYLTKGNLDEVDRFEKAVAVVKAGIGKAGEPMILPKGAVEVDKSPLDMQDMQFEQLAMLTRQEMLAVAGSSDAMVGISGAYNRSNVDSVERIMALGTVDPLNALLADAMNGWLLPLYTGQSDTSWYELSYKSVAVADDLTQAQRMTVLAGGPVYTPNEARQELGREPLVGEDELRNSAAAQGGGGPLSLFGQNQNANKQGGGGHESATGEGEPHEPGTGPPGKPFAPPKPSEIGGGGGGKQPGMGQMDVGPKPKGMGNQTGVQAPAAPMKSLMQTRDPDDDRGERYNENHDPHTGQFTTGDGGGSAAAAAEKTASAPAAAVASPVAEQHLSQLKSEWARTNNQLLQYVDHPDAPQAKALAEQMKAIVKETYSVAPDASGASAGQIPGVRDVVVVGGGPGGLAASIMAGTDGLRTTLIEANVAPGGQAKYSSRIENFPGFPIGVTGEKLAANMYDQAQRLGADVQTGVKVTGLSYDPKTGLKTVQLSDGRSLQARSVIIASGLEFRRLTVPGADAKDVIYGDGKTLTAECKGSTAVVYGGSNGAAQAALGASPTAKDVYLVSRSPITKDMSDYQVQAIKNDPKIHVIEGDPIAAIDKDAQGHVNGVTLASGKRVPCRALGVFIGSVPNVGWLPKEIATENGRIHVDSNLETTLPGVFAAGEIRTGSISRVGAAVGDGQFAERGVFQYFNRVSKGAPRAAAADGGEGAKPTAEPVVWGEIVDQAFALDDADPWFGQTVEETPPDDGGNDDGPGGGDEPPRSQKGCGCAKQRQAARVYRVRDGHPLAALADEAVRAAKWEQLAAVRQRAARGLVEALAPVFERWRDRVTAEIRAKGIGVIVSKGPRGFTGFVRDLTADDVAMQEIADAYNPWSTEFVRQVVERVLADYGLSEEDIQTMYDSSAWTDLTDWVAARGPQLAKQITETTVDDVIQTVEDQLDQGGPIDDVIAAAAAMFPTDGSPRMDAIGDTEASYAEGQGTYGAGTYLQSDYELPAEGGGGNVGLQWLSMRDNRVRDTHVEADGQVVALGDFFDVGSCQMQYPGDYDNCDDLGELINCRCSAVVVPIEDVTDQAPRSGRFNPNHDPHSGEFSSGDGGGDAGAAMASGMVQLALATKETPPSASVADQTKTLIAKHGLTGALDAAAEQTFALPGPLTPAPGYFYKVYQQIATQAVAQHPEIMGGYDGSADFTGAQVTAAAGATKSFFGGDLDKAIQLHGALQSAALAQNDGWRYGFHRAVKDALTDERQTAEDDALDDGRSRFNPNHDPHSGEFTSGDGGGTAPGVPAALAGTLAGSMLHPEEYAAHAAEITHALDAAHAGEPTWQQNVAAVQTAMAHFPMIHTAQLGNVQDIEHVGLLPAHEFNKGLQFDKISGLDRAVFMRQGQAGGGGHGAVGVMIDPSKLEPDKFLVTRLGLMTVKQEQDAYLRTPGDHRAEVMAELKPYMDTTVAFKDMPAIQARLLVNGYENDHPEARGTVLAPDKVVANDHGEMEVKYVGAVPPSAIIAYFAGSKKLPEFGDKTAYEYLQGKVPAEKLVQYPGESLPELSAAYRQYYASPRGRARFNPNHDPHSGEFTTGDGGSAAAGTASPSATVPLDAGYQRPAPIVTKDINQAVELVLQGKVVELPDTRSVYTLTTKLAAMAADAKAKGKDAPNYDLCNVEVAGTNLFCASKVTTPEFPGGIPRIRMPQLAGHPQPGSLAAKFPAEPYAPGEVDGALPFIHTMQKMGIGVTDAVVPAAKLKASQAQLNGQKVAAMANNPGFDPGNEPLFVSRDNYVIDGHHRWAALVERDAADGKLGDVTVRVHRVDAPITEVLKIANEWTRRVGLAASGIPSGPRFNPNHDPHSGEFTSGDGGSASTSTAVAAAPAAASGATSDAWLHANPAGNPDVFTAAQRYLQGAKLPPLQAMQPQALTQAEGTTLANSYEAAADDPSNADTKAAYAAFNQELAAQRKVAEAAGFTFEPWNKPGQPYANSKEMMADVRDHHHLYYFKSTEGTKPNELMSLAQNDTFRAVHDLFGHAMGGNQFGPKGETNAFLDHVQMFSPLARKALATETLGQNAWFNFSKANAGLPLPQRRFADQKAFLLDPRLYQPLIDRALASAHTHTFTLMRQDDSDEAEYYFACPCHRPTPSERARFNPNHDPHTGEFTSGDGGGTATAETHLAAGSSAADRAVLASHANDAAKSLLANGGFSLTRALTPETAKGYYVSLAGAEQKIPLAEFSPEKILAYHDRYATELAKDPSLVLGGWKNPDDGKVYLDLSRAFGSKEAAVEFGKKNGQHSGYDAHTGESFVILGKRSDLTAEQQAAKLKAMVANMLHRVPLGAPPPAKDDGV